MQKSLLRVTNQTCFPNVWLVCSRETKSALEFGSFSAFKCLSPLPFYTSMYLKADGATTLSGGQSENTRPFAAHWNLSQCSRHSRYLRATSTPPCRTPFSWSVLPYLNQLTQLWHYWKSVADDEVQAHRNGKFNLTAFLRIPPSFLAVVQRPPRSPVSSANRSVHRRNSAQHNIYLLQHWIQNKVVLSVETWGLRVFTTIQPIPTLAQRNFV